MKTIYLLVNSSVIGQNTDFYWRKTHSCQLLLNDEHQNTSHVDMTGTYSSRIYQTAIRFKFKYGKLRIIL